MARGRVLVLAGQQIQAGGEPLEQFAGRENLCSRRGKLDPERIAVEPTHELAHGGVVCVRIEAGQLEVRRQSVELRDIVDDARALVEALLHQRRQALEVDVPVDLGLQGDGTRLTQVFVNLIANASKFAPEGTPIRVGARRDAAVVSAWVEDAGPGLPEDDAVSIFERFKRGGVQEPEPGGLGLGLWISRSIIERHGGTITAARTPEGLTRFTLTLPAEPTGTK